MFEWNICLTTANDPVLTKCGHLYCWKWIHQWMNQQSEYIIWPICKSGISKESVIPIYSGTEKKTHPKDAMNKEDENSNKNTGESGIPQRPRAERQDPVRNQNLVDSVFRRISEQERNNLAQNDFLYNASQLIAFMGSNSFSWERIEREIYHSRREEQQNRGKGMGWEFCFMIGFTVVLSLFLFDIDLYIM